jgi:hypothetical protein
MKKLLFIAAFGLAGPLCGSVTAKECDGHHIHGGGLALTNVLLPGVEAFHNGQHVSMYDPGIGCTKRMAVQPGAPVQELVTDLTGSSDWQSFSRFEFGTAIAAGASDSLTFRSIDFVGLDDVRRTIDFQYVGSRSYAGVVEHRIAVTYTQKRPDGIMLDHKIVSFAIPAANVWMRFDLTPAGAGNPWGADVEGESTLRIRFVDGYSQAVLSEGSVTLPANVVPMTLHQGVLRSGRTMTGVLAICTAFPGQGGMPDSLVPDEDFSRRLCPSMN